VLALQRQPKFITMNQLAYHKGADLFIKLAAQMPDQEFRIVGSAGWMPEIDLPSNLVYVGPLDPKHVYAETKVFIAPSRINESFGRCVVEAQMNGIPVLASNRGGPRYDNLVASEYRIDEIDDIDRWVDRLRWVLANLSEAEAQARNREFGFCKLESNIEHFVDLMHGL
jgi:glycosyltransferase involved in cell wall biosynthesis